MLIKNAFELETHRHRGLTAGGRPACCMCGGSQRACTGRAARVPCASGTETTEPASSDSQDNDMNMMEDMAKYMRNEEEPNDGRHAEMKNVIWCASAPAHLPTGSNV